MGPNLTMAGGSIGDVIGKLSAPIVASAALERLAYRSDVAINPEYAKALATALRTNEWTEVGQRFQNGEAISPSGYLFHIAPYLNRRSPAQDVQLTALFGRVVPLNLDEVWKGVCQVGRMVLPDLFFGHLPPRIIPIQVAASSGLAAGAHAEFFFPPEFWQFPSSTPSPALLNVKLLREFALGPASTNTKKLFSPESCEILLRHHLNPDVSEILFAFEYQLHEVGHALGVGIDSKIAGDWLEDNWMRAVEEWRADGMEYAESSFAVFEYRANGSPPREFRDLSQGDGNSLDRAVLSTNLLMRFGIDSQRIGDPTDVDRVTSLLLFDRLLRGGDIDIDRNGKLVIKNWSSGSSNCFGRLLAKEVSDFTDAERECSTIFEYRELVRSVTISPEGQEAFHRIVRRDLD